MFDVDLIVLNKSRCLYPTRNWGGPWVGGRRRMGGGDARVLAPAQWVNPSITESPLPASKAKRLPEELSSNPGSSRLCSCACVP